MAAQRKSLSRSMEDYLETIFHLTQDRGFARVKDIASRMNVHMPSVTGALQTLSGRGLVNYEPYAVVTLTPRGEVVARQLVRTHVALKTFLTRILGLPDSQADDDACRMEHAISDKTLNRLIDFIEFVDAAPEAPCRRLEEFAGQHRPKTRRQPRKTRARGAK